MIWAKDITGIFFQFFFKLNIKRDTVDFKIKDGIVVVEPVGKLMQLFIEAKKNIKREKNQK
jgi:hypothetical protein